MSRIKAAAVLLFVIAGGACARGDDFGPRGEVAKLRSDAHRLLAHRVRATGDPNAVTVSDITVVKDQAVLSWSSGVGHGVMGLVRFLDRWWDALDMERRVPNPSCWNITTTFPLESTAEGVTEDPLDALSKAGMAALATQAAKHNADFTQTPAPQSSLPCHVESGAMDEYQGFPVEFMPPRQSTAGYQIAMHFSQNDAAKTAAVTQIYGRAPTQTEMLPNPAPPRGFGGPTDVFYFDLGTNKPVAFTVGTTIDLWFPFVLDDSLSYRLSYVMDDKFSQSIHGTVFDNVLHFELPAFTIVPPDTMQAEVEGFW